MNGRKRYKQRRDVFPLSEGEVYSDAGLRDLGIQRMPLASSVLLVPLPSLAPSTPYPVSPNWLNFSLHHGHRWLPNYITSS